MGATLKGCINSNTNPGTLAQARPALLFVCLFVCFYDFTAGNNDKELTKERNDTK